MFEDKICAVDFCEGAAVASLAQQDFCLNHFIDLCYENLQRIDPRAQKIGRVPLDLPNLRAFIEEPQGSPKSGHVGSAENRP